MTFVSQQDAEAAMRVLASHGFKLEQAFGPNSTIEARNALIDILKRDTMTGKLHFNHLNKLAQQRGLIQ